MATLTSTAVANNTMRQVHTGVNALSVDFNAGATAISISATTILMARIPHGATIVGITSLVTSGAATTPYDLGIGGGVNDNLSAFGNAIAAGAISHGEFGLPYDVSVTDTAVPYETLAVTVTPASVTASVKVSLTVLYTMDQNRVYR